jgi:hypothetical protein
MAGDIIPESWATSPGIGSHFDWLAFLPEQLPPEWNYSTQ